jgi:hypothetical protein
MKSISFFLFFLCALSCAGQKNIESLNTEWPPEYKWKVVKRTGDQMFIIPGRERINRATIIGILSAMKGIKLPSVDSIISFYRSGLDTGSTLTVLDQSHDSTLLWVLFKVETPKTEKYPEPESDLYYAAQGDYALYDTHVAIKASTLAQAFIDKWSIILKGSKIAKLQ